MNGGQVDESEIRGGSGRRPKRKSDDEVSEAASKMLKIDERNCWCHHKRDTICLLGFHSYVFYLQNASKPSRDISELVLICNGNSSSRMFFCYENAHFFSHCFNLFCTKSVMEIQTAMLFFTFLNIFCKCWITNFYHWIEHTVVFTADDCDWFDERCWGYVTISAFTTVCCCSCSALLSLKICKHIGKLFIHKLNRKKKCFDDGHYLPDAN